MNRVPVGSIIERVYYHVIPYKGAIYKVAESETFVEARAAAIKCYRDKEEIREADIRDHGDQGWMPVRRPWIVERWYILYPEGHSPQGGIDQPMEMAELTDAMIHAAERGL